MPRSKGGGQLVWRKGAAGQGAIEKEGEGKTNVSDYLQLGWPTEVIQDVDDKYMVADL